MTSNGIVLQQSTGQQTLHPRHFAELHEGSGISPEVIAQRGAYTVTTRDELLRLGFTQKGLHTTGYMLPIHTLNGWEQGYAYKPDVALEEVKPDGTIKRRKYLRPPKSSNRLDVPPACCSMVLDISKPLIFTEGWKKGDAAASKGLAVAALGGVWNWRTKDENGESRPIPCLDYIPLRNRRVAICYDSDAAHNPNVRKAEEALAEELHRRGALVFYIRLPGGPNGEKVGLDDYLKDHEAWEVWALAERAYIPEVTELKAQIRELTRRQSARVRLATNPHTRKYQAVAEKLAAEYERAKASQEPTPIGYQISHSRLRGVEYDPDTGLPDKSKKAICSEGTAKTHLEDMSKIIPGLKVTKQGGIVTLRKKDPKTGQLVPHRDVYSELTYVNWSGSPADLLEALAEYTTEKPERRGGHRCPSCGSKKIKVDRYVCTGCGDTFHKPAEEEPQPEPDDQAAQWKSFYERVGHSPSKFEGEETEALSTVSPLPIASNVAGDRPPRTVFLPEPPSTVAKFESVHCSDCAAPDLCGKQGYCVFPPEVLQ